MDPAAFYTAKLLELQQRHQKHENTPHSLEPNCKESPGGLRDLQILLWTTKAAGLGRSWDSASACNGWRPRARCARSKANESLLSLIRARLHLLARRREDRLVFDLQAALAESFGYHAILPGAGQERESGRAPRQRTADAALLLGGQGGQPAQPDPAAQHRGVNQRCGKAEPVPRPINQRFSTATASWRSRATISP